MAPIRDVGDVLDSLDTPTRVDFACLVQRLHEKPGSLQHYFAGLSEEDVDLLLSARSDRISELFQVLQATNRSTTTRETRMVLAEAQINVVLSALPRLESLINGQQAIDMILPVLRFSLDVKSRQLSRLAFVLTEYKGLLKRMCADNAGGLLARQWLSYRDLFPCDRKVLRRWTEIVCQIVNECPADKHEMDEKIETWRKLSELQQGLLAVKEQIQNDTTTRSQHNSARLPGQGVPIKLTESNKGSIRLDHTEEKPQFPTISTELWNLHNLFSMRIPTCWSALTSNLDTLELQNTRSILEQFIASFPCKKCLTGCITDEANMRQSRPILGPSISHFSQKDTDYTIFGREVGRWTVLISTRAKRRLDAVTSAGELV